MAYEFYVTITGEKQGKFKGESIRASQKDKLAGLSYNHEIISPRDAATGQASGKRQHRPASFTKEWGAATPQIFQALCTNEVLKEVLFEFYKTNAKGEEYIYHTVKLTGATVCQVKYSTGGLGAASAKHTEKTDTLELEEVYLSYDGITVENKDGKTMGEDKWTK